MMGAAIGAGVLYLIGWVYLKLRKVEGMGLGDVKLMAMAGAFLGPLLTLFVLCTASMLGGAYGICLLLTVFRGRLLRYRVRLGDQAPARAWRAANVAMQGLEIPFGVFLGVMSIVAWFYGVAAIRGYLRLLFIPG
jgi:leader peptidase (prepilin peptidase)/N-methyltransferase